MVLMMAVSGLLVWGLLSVSFWVAMLIGAPIASTDSITWIADSGLFIACGHQQNNKYTAIERFARRNDITFAIPQRVYDELGGAPDRSTPGQTPINSAIDAEWVAVADEPDYTDSTVSRVLDDVRSYIATSSNRDEDQIEKADTALGAVAVERLSNMMRSSSPS